jgi:hypothetical protein
MFLHGAHDLLQGQIFPSGQCVRRITVAAAKIASREPYERTDLARMGGFSLDAFKDFTYRKHKKN